MTYNYKVFVILLLSIGLLLGCKEAEETLEQGYKLAKQGVDTVAPQAEQATNLANSQIESLYRQEYLVRDFDSSVSAETMQAELNKIGADRWQCFSIQAREDGTVRVTCSRLPLSYLRYLLRIFP